MKGFKAFNNDLTCLGYQYKEDQVHVYDGEPVLCTTGFHFCTELQDVVKYYSDPKMRVFEIEATGLITDPKDDCSKRACSEIKLIKELSLDQVKASINKSKQAYWWAYSIGDKEHMKQYVTDPKYANLWVKYIDPDDEPYFQYKGIL